MSQKSPWLSEFERVPNRLQVLRMLRDEGPVSRAEIARRLDLSRPTASRIVDALVEDGVIRCVGKSRPTGGRLGDLYTFRADAGVVGLELGTRQARAAVATLDGEIVRRIARPLSLETRHGVLPQLRDLVAQATNAPAMPTAVLAIGGAVPGVVHAARGYVDAANNFQGLNDRPLQGELEHLFGVPVTMDNDVNLAAIGECQFGCGRGHGNVAYLFVGRGIGAGLVLGGHLFRGAADAAGEIGNMVVDRSNLHERFGARGCLESVAGIDRLVTGARERGLPYETAEAVCEGALSGEPGAQATIHDTNEYLAAALINLVAVIDPDIIVIGGDLGELPHAEGLFVRPIERLMRRQVGGVPRMQLSSLQGDAALYGAVHAALGVALTAAGRSGTRSAASPKLGSAIPVLHPGFSLPERRG